MVLCDEQMPVMGFFGICIASGQHRHLSTLSSLALLGVVCVRWDFSEGAGAQIHGDLLLPSQHIKIRQDEFLLPPHLPTPTPSQLLLGSGLGREEGWPPGSNLGLVNDQALQYEVFTSVSWFVSGGEVP